MNARKVALEALIRVESGGYSTLTLDALLKKSGLDGRDKALATQLFYGVLEKQILLDYVILQFCKTPPKKLERTVLMLLRLGVYQLLYMDKIPDNAAVDESVKLCRQVGLERASGMVNAVLRALIRAGKRVGLPDISTDYVKHISIAYSCPEWIVSLWLDSYGKCAMEAALASLLEKAKTYARVNTQRVSVPDFIAEAGKSGVKASDFTPIEGAVILESAGAVDELDIYKKGLFHAQDVSSQLCCALLDPKPGELIYDVCAAPGGKSFTIAELAGDDCRVISCDIHPQRVALIEAGAKRLGLQSVQTKVRDAASQDDINIADRVLCDVPCSGLGVIRRKPDIKLKRPEDIENLPGLQLSILEASAELLKPGGVLVYSTCTLNPAENGEVVRKFLQANSSFEPMPLELPAGFARLADEPEHMFTLFPQVADTDGFFIAKMRRKG